MKIKNECTGETLHYSTTFDAKIQVDYEVQDQNEELNGYIFDFLYEGFNIIIDGDTIPISKEFLEEQFKRFLKKIESKIEDNFREE